MVTTHSIPTTGGQKAHKKGKVAKVLRENIKIKKSLEEIIDGQIGSNDNIQGDK